MPQGHKVRLHDGSVIHLDREGLRSWYRRGLIGADSPVQVPGSSTWTRLHEVLGIARPSAATPPTAARPQPRPRIPARWKPVIVAGGVAAALAVLAWAGLRFGLWGGSGAPAGPLPARARPDAHAQAVEAVTRDAPHLSARTAELLMSQSAAQVLYPPEAFRRAYLLTGRGLGALSKAEAREFGTLNSAVYAMLSPTDRRRLGDYIERVRARQPTTQGEDAEMARVFRSAVMKLPAPRQERLRALFEKAVEAAGFSAP
jgi:hypothetical protein